MALGFFLGIENGIGKFFSDNKVHEVPANKIPEGMKPGQDFNFRSSKRGNIHITAPSDPSTPKATNSARDRQLYAMKRLVSKGWTPIQASGIVGRLMQESYADLRTTAVGDKEIPGASHGIAQWNRERKAAMIAYTTGRIPDGPFKRHPLVLAAKEASPGNRGTSSFDAQLDFWDWEIKHSPAERLAFATLSKAETPEEAAIGMMHFERPSGYTPGGPRRGHGFNNTIRNAERLAKMYDPNFRGTVADSVADLGDGVPPAGGEEDLGQGMIEPQDPTLLETITGQEISEEDEDTLGGIMSDGSAGMEGEPVDTSNTQLAIDRMIQQGFEANQGALPGLPTLKDIFGGIG